MGACSILACLVIEPIRNRPPISATPDKDGIRLMSIIRS